MLSNYDDDYSQGYSQIKEVLGALTIGNILQLLKSEDDFGSSNVGDDGNEIGYQIHAFDIRYQKNFESAQPIKVEFKNSAIIPTGIYG